MGETEEFDTLAFEKRLTQLKDTQESIQSLSSWCLKQREHHKKIVQSWLNVLKIVKIDQRLVLFYLANDVIQYSKRKNYEFVESWGLNLQKATPLVRDEKVRHKILRIFKIWEQRSVYDEEFLSDLTGLLSVGATKKTDDDNIDFQPQQLVNKIKQCTVLEADTDLRLKNIHDCPLQLSDAEELCTSLKDRSIKEDVDKELNEGILCVERYTAALQREIVAREALLALLTSANQYYSTQRGEVKVVAYAYKNFGARVRALKRKLDELCAALPLREAAEPPRESDVPSPAPDEDIDLPDADMGYNIDKTFNTSLTADGSLYNLGLSSFLNTNDAMQIFNSQTNDNGSKIEVINIRPNEKQDFDMENFIKNIVPSKETSRTPDSGSVVSAQSLALPGLDLLAPPKPGSFYGSTVDITDDQEPYSVSNSPWNASAVAGWSMPLPPAPVPPPPLAYASPPASPPHKPPLQPSAYTTIPTVKEVKSSDVDHRALHSLPPPPPPPLLLSQLEDVDHRSLPPPPVAAPLIDVDHRNLISLTHQPPPLALPSRGMDQDYRVPPPVPPPDIVESVDMDLSEDEESHPNSQSHYHDNEDPRRNYYNKVVVGSHNGKLHDRIARRMNSVPENQNREHYPIDPPLSAPISGNKFDNHEVEDFRHYEDANYERSQSPFREEFEEYRRDPPPGRVQRNWTPRSQRPFWPRNGPRPNRPWGSNPQRHRFW